MLRLSVEALLDELGNIPAALEADLSYKGHCRR